MSAAHAVFVEVAAILLPLFHEIARGDRHLLAGGADHGVIGDPIGVGAEQIETGVNGFSARDHLLQRPKVFFATAARFVDLQALVVTDIWKVTGVEERTVVGELGQFIPIAETTSGVSHREREHDHLPWRQRPIERIDGVEIPGRSTYQVEWPVKTNVPYGLPVVRDVNLRDRLRPLVLQGEPAHAVKGAALWVNVDGRVYGRDLGLRKQFVFLKVTLVTGLNVAAILGGKILVQNVSIVEIPKAAAGGAQKQECGRWD